MTVLAIPNTFSANTTISSSQVNSNFSTLYNDYNGSISAANLATDAVTTVKIADSNVTTAKIANDAVTFAKAANGFCVQEAGNIVSAVATGTTTIPWDDTIPQNTEGDQYLSQAITPKSATNILVIEVTALVTYSVASKVLIMALFQDTTANALAATHQMGLATGGFPGHMNIRFRMVAGTTSSTTFKVRIGAETSGGGTLTLNGQSSARKFGGVASSSISIREYKAA